MPSSPSKIIVCGLAALLAISLAAGQERSKPDAGEGAREELQLSIQDLQAQVKSLQMVLERLALKNRLNHAGTKVAAASSDPEVRWQDARREYEEAVKAEEQGRYTAAVDHYSSVILLDATNDSAYLHRGPSPPAAGRGIVQLCKK